MNEAWKVTRPKAHAEDDFQAAVVQHLRLLAPKNVIWYHPANGGQRSKRSAARMKAAGVMPGVPDLAFVLSDGTAAFMELKAVGGHLSPEQKAFEAKCAVMGVPYVVCYGIDSALAVLKAWGVLP